MIKTHFSSQVTKPDLIKAWLEDNKACISCKWILTLSYDTKTPLDIEAVVLTGGKAVHGMLATTSIRINAITPVPADAFR